MKAKMLYLNMIGCNGTIFSSIMHGIEYRIYECVYIYTCAHVHTHILFIGDVTRCYTNAFYQKCIVYLANSFSIYEAIFPHYDVKTVNYDLYT